ncbi:MAG: hypothetical protein ACE5LG_01790 [Anaerolineae bacterium]
MCVDSVVEATTEMEMSRYTTELGDWRLRFELMAKPYPMIVKAAVVGKSLDDQELAERFDELTDVVEEWIRLVDLKTGKAVEGKEEELQELSNQVTSAAAQVKHRIREILEEV